MASILRTSFLLSHSSIGMASPETRRSLPGLCIKPRTTVRPLQIKPYSNLPKPRFFFSVIASAASGEVSKLEEVEETQLQEESDREPIIDNGSSDGGLIDGGLIDGGLIDGGLIDGSSSDESIPFAEDKSPSAVITSLEFYKEALTNNDQSKVAEIEAFLQSIEDEKNSIENKITSLSEELVVEKDRILRISADFDNFRKRTERERLSLMNNVQGEVIESLLPVLDNFERAKVQIKAETEGEEKINSSYQSIYKQFMEILASLGVVAVETVGNTFDPMLHEAIMREDSLEFEEDTIVQEFRKGFKLGERLLRPAMVKVSAGPGPAEPARSAEPVGPAELEEDAAPKPDEGSKVLEQADNEESDD